MCKPTGKVGEGETLWICKGMEEGLFDCAYTLHTHQLFLQNWDVLMQLKFIATIHEVKNVRLSQPRPITACNRFLS